MICVNHGRVLKRLALHWTPRQCRRRRREAVAASRPNEHTRVRRRTMPLADADELATPNQYSLRPISKRQDLLRETFERSRILIPLFGATVAALLFPLPAAESSPSRSLLCASVSVSSDSALYSWGDVLQYRFQKVFTQQKIMAMQMFGKLCAVFLAALPILVIGGLSYKIATGRNLNAALFKVYSVMSSIPGASAVEADNAVGLFLCSLVFFAGTFTVAVTLGIVCDDISTLVATVRNGNYQVIEDKHVVILNVNERLRSVLSQIAEASKERGSFRCPIVILDDMDKNELDDLVAKAAEGLDLSLMTRQGCTHDVTDLKRVAAGRAKCVIWLEPDDEELFVAARRASAIASLKTLGIGEDHASRMIVQTSQDSAKSKQDLTTVPLAFRSPPPSESSRFSVVEVYEEENLDRFLAQCALQPHLSEIMTDIFQHNEGKEFYITADVDFGGQTYAAARRHFFHAVVCGIYTPGSGNETHGRIQLNPPEDTVLRREDELIVLCSDLWHAKPKGEKLPATSEWTQKVPQHRSPYCSEHIVVLAFGKDGFADSGLVEALGRFAARSTRVTIVAEAVAEKVSHNGKCSLSYIEGNPASFKTLKKLKRKRIDSVVLAGLEDLPPKIADAQLVSSLIQIQEVANVYWEDRSGFNVVSPVNFPETRLVAQHLIRRGNARLQVPVNLDVVLPIDLSSGVLVQVAGFPQLDLVFKELLSAAGSELYIRNMEEYDLVGRGPVKSYEVADIARQRKETFLGVLKADETFFLAPDALSERTYSANEKIVVLADGFQEEVVASKGY